MQIPANVKDDSDFAFKLVLEAAMRVALNPPAAQPAIPGDRVETLERYFMEMGYTSDEAEATAGDMIERGLLTAPVVKPAQVTAEQIAECVLRAAGSGGLKHYMPYTKDKILADLKALMDGGA
jgi:hypothetical protein